MKLTIYKGAKDFLEDNRELLTKHSIEANIVLVNTLSDKLTGDDFFAASVKDESTTYLAIRTLPMPMVNFAVGKNINELAAYFAQYLTDNDCIPKKVSGPDHTINLFVQNANKLGACFSESRHLYLRRCTQVKDIKTVNGKYHSPAKDCFDYGGWIAGFIKECELDDPVGDASEKAKKMIQNKSLTCFESDGKIVTMAAQTRVVKGGRCVGMVYAPPEHRGQGYSIANMKYLTQEILDDGHDCAFLYADKYNPISNHIYQKLGYEKIGDFLEYSRK